MGAEPGWAPTRAEHRATSSNTRQRQEKKGHLRRAGKAHGDISCNGGQTRNIFCATLWSFSEKWLIRTGGSLRAGSSSDQLIHQHWFNRFVLVCVWLFFFPPIEKWIRRLLKTNSAEMIVCVFGVHLIQSFALEYWLSSGKDARVIQLLLGLQLRLRSPTTCPHFRGTRIRR